jgi:hypothetical protein
MAARRAKFVVVTALLAAAAAPQMASRAAPALDYEFFKLRVQPIFLQKRDGHTRCYVCHAESRATTRSGWNGSRPAPAPGARSSRARTSRWRRSW